MMKEVGDVKEAAEEISELKRKLAEVFLMPLLLSSVENHTWHILFCFTNHSNQNITFCIFFECSWRN